MQHGEIKSLFNSAVKNVTDSISKYAKNPDKDFSRTRKFPADMLMKFLVSQGSSSTKNELAGFFGFDAAMPAESALCQQRAKLKPEEGYKRFIDRKTAFDFIEYRSMDTFELSFRIVRFPLSLFKINCIRKTMYDIIHVKKKAETNEKDISPYNHLHPLGYLCGLWK